MTGLRRRDLLGLLAGLGLVGWIGRVPRAPYEGVRRLVARAESAQLLGAAYLREHPEVRSASDLAAQLGLEPGDAVEETRTRVAERHREDLRSGAVERLGGFLFSRTELRLCALLHLLGPT